MNGTVTQHEVVSNLYKGQLSEVRREGQTTCVIRCAFDLARLQLTVSLKLYGDCYLVATTLVT